MKQHIFIHRGFATITAITLMGLVGVSFTAITLSIAADSRRTAGETADAQLRQLLIAGSAQARQMLDHGRQTTGDVPLVLPPSISSIDAAVVIHFITVNNTTTTQVNARLGSRSAQHKID